MIAEKICADIKSGELVPGMSVPSSRELAETFEVSQLTAIHALKYLVQKGVLLHKPGKNYSVARKEDTQTNACRFLTLLFRYISTKGPEFYGNRIISGIMNETGLSSVGTYYKVSFVRAYINFTIKCARNIAGFHNQISFSKTRSISSVCPVPHCLVGMKPM